MPPYAEILRALPWGVVVLHLEDPHNLESFRIVDFNRVAAEIMGSTVEELRGKTFADFPDLSRTGFPACCLSTLQSGEPKKIEEISYGDEHIRAGVYSSQIFPLSDNFLGVAFESVTDRKRAEHAQHESEQRLRLLIHNVREYAIFQLNPRGEIISWNAGAERLKGFGEEEIIGKHFSIFYPEEDVRAGKPEQKLKDAAQYGQSVDEGWRIRKDESRFWAHVVITPIFEADGNLRGFVKVTRDMTEGREKEEALTRAKELLELRVEQRAAVLTRVNAELRTEIAEREKVEGQLRASLDQLRALAARLLSVREEERTHIAREIHDELGQACTAIKMDLALVSRKATKKQVRLRAKAESATQLVDKMIVTLRRIASELRPGTLDDLGLTAALEWQAHEFESHTGIRCRVTFSEEHIAIGSEQSTAIFRIFQESLTNVARHAQATLVEAHLQKEADHLILQVRDNGIGFDPEAAKNRKSLGLVGMNERALAINGNLKIEGVPGTGTTMTLRIPMSLTHMRNRNESSDS
jgi:PAS domain S-box-containing protein